MTKFAPENQPLVLTNPSCQGTPCQFISACSIQNKAIITNLNVCRIEQRPTFSRVCCDITIPLRVTYKDTDGQCCHATSHITCHQDVILFTPEDSIFPYEILATASANAPTGTVTRDGQICATVCCTAITKVCTETDLLIPTYGVAVAPSAVNFREDACREFFNLPLYPRGNDH